METSGGCLCTPTTGEQRPVVDIRKLVFGNQMKSIISNVVATPYVAEDGTVIDICFSRQSIANRIVNSMDLQGTSNTVLKLIEAEMIRLYTNQT